MLRFTSSGLESRHHSLTECVIEQVGQASPALKVGCHLTPVLLIRRIKLDIISPSRRPKKSDSRLFIFKDIGYPCRMFWIEPE